MKILIVKLGAMGDVLRTTPLLTAYKKNYPGSHVTWVVDAESAAVLRDNPQIDRLVIWNPQVPSELARGRFDLGINLDKEKEALDSIAGASAAVKKGFGWNAGKTGVAALNPASEYAVRLGTDDELKFRLNQKTYQQISFEQAEVPYTGEDYVLNVAREDEAYADRELARRGLEPRSLRRSVGLNTGSGARFAGKRLPEEHLTRLAHTLASRLGRKVVLLGGPSEREHNEKLERACGGDAVDAGTGHTITQFAAIVSRLGAVITGDTIAMHVAVAVKVPVVAFFGSTCASEIELYGRGLKIVSKIECAPCYKRVCPIEDKEKCMKDMDVELMVRNAEELLQLRMKN